MMLLRLVLAFIGRRPLTWAFHVLTLAVGVAIVLSLLLVDRAVEARFARDLAGVDLVIGAKGSPLQLVLSAVFQMDAPTGNIPIAEAERFSRNPLVRSAIPLAMGDSYGGVRIVGATRDYLDLYGAAPEEGRLWARPMEAVIGADVARRQGLRLGQSFVGSHGFAPGGERHEQAPYVVVGVLKATGAVVDRLIITDLASVWAIHGHDADRDKHRADEPEHGDHEAEGHSSREVTALLIRYRSAMGAVVLPGQVRRTPDLQAAAPPIELARLFSLLGSGLDLLRGVGLVVVGLSGAGFFVGLIAAVSQRRRDLALLRALGASPRRLLSIVALEAALLGAAGGLMGILGARGLMALLSVASARGLSGPILTAPPPGGLEVMALALATGLAVIAAILPAWVASRADPAKELA
ncbi:MAG TPA: FtsX-like permease family protein [Caulobacter sp.]|nr:FtsX-like permease family protein [Caulobacter sp.]